MTDHKFGWNRDLPDPRDLWYHNYKTVRSGVRQDTVVDLRHNCPPIWDQGDLGSCTSFAIAGALEYNQIQQNELAFEPSHLFIYYNERALEGSIPYDAGAEIRDGIKSVGTTGYCSERLWPYHIEYFAFKPPAVCYGAARHYKALEYYRLDNTNLDILRTCLDTKEVFVFGASVFRSFFQGDIGGHVPMPGMIERPEGGHALCCVGYNDHTKEFIIRNSWGGKVGDHGIYYMPYDYLTNPNLCDDFWTIKQVT